MQWIVRFWMSYVNNSWRNFLLFLLHLWLVWHHIICYGRVVVGMKIIVVDQHFNLVHDVCSSKA
jgi:hypothetical protein